MGIPAWAEPNAAWKGQIAEVTKANGQSIQMTARNLTNHVLEVEMSRKSGKHGDQVESTNLIPARAIGKGEAKS